MSIIIKSGSTGDLADVNSSKELKVALSAGVTADTELPAAAALADAAANPTTPTVGADNQVFNGTTWDRAKSATAASATTGTGLPGAGVLGFDGTNYQRLKTDTAGNQTALLVDAAGTNKAKVGTGGDQTTSLTNPNSATAGIYAGVTSYGVLRTSTEPHALFGDPFDGTLDTTNRWTTTGSTVAPSTAIGKATLVPGAATSAATVMATQPTFGPIGVNFLAVGFVAQFENINATAGTLFYLNSHRFLGLGTVPAAWVSAYTASSASGPLLDAIGFEVDVDGKMYPVVYANGTRTRPALSFGGTDIATGNGTGSGATFGGLKALADGNLHQFGLAIRADVVFWYVDSLDIPIASFKYSSATYTMPNVQTLPLRLHTINGASSAPSGTMDLRVGAIGVGDTGSNSSQLSDGTYPWRKAKVDSYGSQNVALQGLAGVAMPLRPDSYLKVAQDPSPLLTDTFDSATLDTTNRWTAGGTAPTVTGGVLTVSAGTTALAVSSLTSQVSFPLLGNMYNDTLSILKVDSGLKTGCYRFTGLGNAAGSPTVSAPLTDAVGFEWLDTTGVLSGVVWSAGSRAQTVSLAAVQPTDGGYHRYSVYFKTSRAYFEIDNVSVGSIAYPSPSISNLPLLSLAVNGASTVSPAAVMQSSFLGVGDSSRNNHLISDATYPWRKAQVGKSGGLSVKGAAVTGTSGAIAAAGTGTVGPVDVSEAGNVTFVIKNTTAASAWAGAPVVVFEQSDDTVSWSPLNVVRSDTNTANSTFTLGAGSANGELMFDAGMEGVNYVRCRVTTGPSTNGFTVVIQPGGMPFSPVVTTIASNPASVTGNGPASVTSAAADTLILAANGNRKGAAVFNDSTAVLYLSLGTAAASTTAFTIKVAAAGYYEVPFAYTGQIRGIWASANGSARITEITP